MKRWLLLAAALLSASCTDLVVGSPPKTDRASIFDDLWSEVDRRYPFLVYKNIDWKAIGDKYRPTALAATSDDAFAKQLGAMLAELKDPHVSLTPSAGNTIRYVSAAENHATWFDGSIANLQISNLRTTSARSITYGMAGSNVGYLRIASFLGGSATEVDEALRNLPDATTLLVDVRDNRGGSRPLAIEVAGRFLNGTHTFAYLRFRNGAAHDDLTGEIAQTVSPAGYKFTGPVQVLANRHTMSAAEDFILAMRTQPNVTVIGDTTAGATGGPMPRELANGWTYELSEWIQYTPQHMIFEDIGLAPDVVVQPTPADYFARRDPALQRAVVRAATF
jgi:C-terminal processing protease CtpA/Prc